MGIFIGAGFTGRGGAGGAQAIEGTPEQVIVTRESGRLVLSAPQNISRESSPVFRGIQLEGPLSGSGQDAATVDYVLNAVTGIASKGMVSAVMVDDLPMIGEGMVDGVRVRPGERVLRACAALPHLNGIYDVMPDGWMRAENSNSWEKMTGALVTAKGGTVFGGMRWACMAEAGGTLETDALEWVMLSASGGVDEAPTDGEFYVRRNGVWSSIIAYPMEVNRGYQVLGKNGSHEIRRYYFTGKLATNSVPIALAAGVRYVLSNGLMVARPQAGGSIQWHSLSNLLPEGEHISSLFLNGETLQLYVHSTSAWAGRDYKGFVDVMMN